MRFRADMAIYDRNGQLILVVEARNKVNTSTEWAAGMRQNMLAHGLMPDTRFFLLALPDHFYLWKNAGITPDFVLPDYDVDPRPFLHLAYDSAQTSPSTLTNESFELIISALLNTLLQTDTLPAKLQNEAWLISSGLFEAIKHGHLTEQTSV